MLQQQSPIHRKQLSETHLQVLRAFLSRDIREASIATNTAITTFFMKISTSDAKAPTTIQSSTKHVAFSALKSNKILETSLESRAKSLAQLEEVLVKIEQAGDNIELVRMREESSKVLARLNKQVGGIEDVGKVADALQEHMEEAGEVIRIFGDETGATAHVDDREVEGEFEALLQEEIKLRIREVEAPLLGYPFLPPFSHQPRVGWNEYNKRKPICTASP